MNTYLKLFALMLLKTGFLFAQINPPNAAALNYTKVMLEYEKINNAGEYVIQITEANRSRNFDKLLIEQHDKSTATLIENLEFGKSYIWRYAGIINNQRTEWKGPYNFGIENNPFLNMSYLRGRILKNDSAKTLDGLLSIDYGKILIDRKGIPVWYLPGVNTKFKNISGARDLQITPQGTFLFMANQKAYECNLNGDIIWVAPDDGKISGDTTEYYHHDFRKLNNGNYMILGEKYSWRNLPSETLKSKFKPENLEIKDGVSRVKILFSTIIEYNKKGQVVWSWNSADYFSDLDLFDPETNTGTPRRDLPANAEIFGHMNAFDTDSTGNKFVYASFRDVSRVIKIDKQTGKVIESWGAKMPSGEAQDGDGFFKNQHDLSVLDDGNILLFNNDDMYNNTNSSSAVEITPRKGKVASQIAWRFDCKFDSLTTGKTSRNGGVELLPNKNVLICMGGINRIVEVDKKNNSILWDAFIESKASDSTPWYPVTMFKSHFCTSLYPCYFTVQSDKDLISSQSASFNLSVFNEGSNADKYSINVYSDSGSKLFSQKEILIASGKSKPVEIKLGKLPANTKHIVVKVTSETNKNLTRELKLSPGN